MRRQVKFSSGVLTFTVGPNAKINERAVREGGRREQQVAAAAHCISRNDVIIRTAML